MCAERSWGFCPAVNLASTGRTLDMIPKAMSQLSARSSSSAWLRDERSRQEPCWILTVSFKKPVWFSSNYSNSLGNQKEMETQGKNEEEGFRTRRVSEKGLKASLEYGGGWQTHSLPSGLHSREVHSSADSP